jgi:hypothetical protein
MYLLSCLTPSKIIRETDEFFVEKGIPKLVYCAHATVEEATQPSSQNRHWSYFTGGTKNWALRLERYEVKGLNQHTCRTCT